MRVSGLYNNMKNVLTKSLSDGGKALSNLNNYYRYGVFGTRIRLEASSKCQLKCAACVRTCSGSKDIFEKGIGQGYLSFKNFKRIIDENPWIKSVELSNWGELFLNPELKEIIEYSYNKKIFITACNGVNLNTIKGTKEFSERYSLIAHFDKTIVPAESLYIPVKRAEKLLAKI